MIEARVPTFLEFMVGDQRYRDLAAYSEPIGMVPDTRHTGELTLYLEDRECGSGLQAALIEAHVDYVALLLWAFENPHASRG